MINLKGIKKVISSIHQRGSSIKSLAKKGIIKKSNMSQFPTKWIHNFHYRDIQLVITQIFYKGQGTVSCLFDLFNQIRFWKNVMFVY